MVDPGGLAPDAGRAAVGGAGGVAVLHRGAHPGHLEGWRWREGHGRERPAAGRQRRREAGGASRQDRAEGGRFDRRKDRKDRKAHSARLNAPAKRRGSWLFASSTLTLAG